LEIKDTSRGILIPRMSMSQRLAIQNPVEGLMVYQTDSAQGIWLFESNDWIILQTKKDTYKYHYIGEYFGGGIIFHLNNDSNGIQHGLIVSLNNVSNGITWGCEDSALNNSSRWNGYTNTIETIRGCGLNNASGICSTYRGGGYSDWYLPAMEELKILFQNSYEVEKTISSISGTDHIMDFLGPNEFWTSTNLLSYNFTQYPNGTTVVNLITDQALTYYAPFNPIYAIGIAKGGFMDSNL
jgi:hypothetical protein